MNVEWERDPQGRLTTFFIVVEDDDVKKASEKGIRTVPISSDQAPTAQTVQILAEMARGLGLGQRSFAEYVQEFVKENEPVQTFPKSRDDEETQLLPFPPKPVDEEDRL